jgi:hypothetical protein
MVETGDAARADELDAGPLAGLVVERLGDTLLAVAATRLDELEGLLLPGRSSSLGSTAFRAR